MKALVNNRRVRYDYFIEDSLVAGIMLEGWEVKAILNNKCSISESYVKIINNELFLIGSNCTPSNFFPFVIPDPTRTRKLLVTKHQLDKWELKIKKSGYTLMVQDIHYSDKKKIKCTLCLCRGKKQHDKRETIKERDIKRSEECI